MQLEPDGGYDVEKCRVALERNTNPEKSRQAKAQQRKAAAVTTVTTDRPQSEDSAGSPERTYSEALRQQAWVKLERDKLDLQKRQAELVELGPINAFIAGMILRARDEMVRIAPELRDQLAQEADPIRCEAMLAKRIERSLGAMAEYRPNVE
ncbi:MAG TPA: hypothetical protein VM120_04405 [Bryobacteraceae bacterium]|nr:hypothetical protein [Bryobacteraceae bacterium]